MKPSDVVGLLGGLIGLVGGVAAILSGIYQRKQTQLMQQQIRGLQSRDSAYDVWTEKWERAADALQKIYPGLVTESNITKNAYRLAFNEPLRQRIEHHLGRKVFFTNKFAPKNLTKDELLNGVVQEVIDEVLHAVEKFKTDHTDWSRSLKLVRPS